MNSVKSKKVLSNILKFSNALNESALGIPTKVTSEPKTITAFFLFHPSP